MAMMKSIDTVVPAALREAVGGDLSGALLHGIYDELGGPVYDDISRNDRHEVAELLRALRGCRGTTLELAAGAGRLTIPMIATGRHVTALELSSTMIALLRRRLEEMPSALSERCTVVQADMSDFDLARTFSAIVIGTTSICLLDAEDRSGLYSCVYGHLNEHGIFIASVLDVPVASGVSTEVVREVRGESGRGYWLAERLEAGGTARTVAVTSVDGTEPRHIGVGTVAVINASVIQEEMGSHGLRVVQDWVVPGVEERYNVHLLVAVAAEGAGI